MRHIICIVFSFITLTTVAQSGGTDQLHAGAIDAKDAYSPSSRMPGTASTQVFKWKNIATAERNDPDAWLNYFIWAERDKEYDPADRQMELSAALRTAKQYIFKTYQYHIMVFLLSGKKDSNAITLSLRLANNRQLVYPYAIQDAIIRNDRQALQQYAMASADVPKEQSNYHYNVLMSADSNATIYAKGLNDLVPLALMQYRHHVRQDIRLKYYDGKIADDKNTYLALSLGSDILAQYPHAGYTGLLVKLQPGDGSELQKHVERDMDLSDLRKELGDHSSIVIQLYRNYLPSLILLYKAYKKNNDPSQAEVKKMIERITVVSGSTAAIDKLLNQ